MVKVKKILSLVLAATVISAVVPTCVNAAWKEDKFGWWYTEGDSYVQNDWRYINGNWYYFNDRGYMETGWVQTNGRWYYLDPCQEGIMVSNQWMWQGYHLNYSGEWDMTANYLRSDIFENSGTVTTVNGQILYEAGDPSPLQVINGEPCLFAMTKNDEFREIGLNTLNVYGEYGAIIDKVKLN